MRSSAISLPTTIPITITPEAAARVAELGMQKELDQMIAHTRQAVPGLQRIDVVLDPPYDTGDNPYLTIWATIDQPLVPRRQDLRGLGPLEGHNLSP